MTSNQIQADILKTLDGGDSPIKILTRTKDEDLNRSLFKEFLDFIPSHVCLLCPSFFIHSRVLVYSPKISLRANLLLPGTLYLHIAIRSTLQHKQQPYLFKKVHYSFDFHVIQI